MELLSVLRHNKPETKKRKNGERQNPKLIRFHGGVFCSIPRLFVYLRMRMSTSK